MDEKVRWLIGVVGVSLLLLVSFYGYYWFTVGDPSHSMEAFRSQGEPVGTLDVNETYEQAPTLAQALDTAIEENRSSVVVSTDEETIDRVRDHLVRTTGDYVDPFLWRGVVFEISVTT